MAVQQCMYERSRLESVGSSYSSHLLSLWQWVRWRTTVVTTAYRHNTIIQLDSESLLNIILMGLQGYNFWHLKWLWMKCLYLCQNIIKTCVCLVISYYFTKNNELVSSTHNAVINQYCWKNIYGEDRSQINTISLKSRCVKMLVFYTKQNSIKTKVTALSRGGVKVTTT